MWCHLPSFADTEVWPLIIEENSFLYQVLLKEKLLRAVGAWVEPYNLVNIDLKNVGSHVKVRKSLCRACGTIALSTYMILDIHAMVK